MKKVKPKIRIPAVIREDKNPLSLLAAYMAERIAEREKCPNALKPDGNVCPRCGKPRALNRTSHGEWIHIKR